MCLIAKTEIRTAKRNIMCYKRLIYRRRVGTFISPFYGETYEVGETKQVKFFTDENNRRIISRTNPVAVSAGLHAYTTLEKAASNPFYTIVRCIIPKGTKYVRGTEQEIVALKLVVKEVVGGF